MEKLTEKVKPSQSRKQCRSRSNGQRDICHKSFSNRRTRCIYQHFRAGRINFFTHRMVVEPRNKVKIQKLSWSLFFLPSVIYLQPSTDTEEDNELRWGKKKNSGVRYLNPKSITINQKKTTTNKQNKLTK